MTTDNKNNKSKQWMRYASLGTQIMVYLFIAVFGGLKLDKWLHATPLFIIVLPTIALLWVFIQLYRQLVK